jgi:hypothetical protein
MRRPALLLSSILALAAPLALLATASCATYRQDLERARAHYEKTEYEPALALFRVLEPDIDSFSPAEYAQYSYSRGMTDYRISLVVASGNAAVDPKQSYRNHARHWLAVARAVEKQTPGGLTPDEQTRLEETLKDLNRDVYGGGDSAPEGDGGAPAAKDKPDKSDKPADKSDKSDK